MAATPSTRKATYDAEVWRSHAACAAADTGEFFPIGSSPASSAQAARAKAVCSTCPVRLRCLEFAITTNQEYGIWGGADEDERRVLRRQWRRGRLRTA